MSDFNVSSLNSWYNSAKRARRCCDILRKCYYYNMSEPQHLRFAVLSTDVAVFTIRDRKLAVRLIKVDRPPHFVDSKGLPGGLIDPKETAEEAAMRLAGQKARIDKEKLYVEQLYTFSDIDRDPRGRVVAVAYLVLVPWEKLSPDEQADSPEAWWSDLHDAKKLAYDHDAMLAKAVSRLRSRVTYTTLISKLMPDEFTLTELELAYGTILGASLDKRNFRKKILKLDIIKPLKGKKKRDKHRPAQLYAFTKSNVQEIEVL